MCAHRLTCMLTDSGSHEVQCPCPLHCTSVSTAGDFLMSIGLPAEVWSRTVTHWLISFRTSEQQMKGQQLGSLTLRAGSPTVSRIRELLHNEAAVQSQHCTGSRATKGRRNV